MRILITGSKGYIGRSLYTALKYHKRYDVTCISRQEDFDLTSFQEMNKFFHGKYFDVVIHCAVQGGSRLKKDSYKDMNVNLAMYYNLLQHKSYYHKLIHFGSGAEIHDPESPYGLSKKIIAKSISEIPNFFNIRIYGVFDENELPTRFIKANILRYIKKEPMMIQDKIMSFFYMQDLITLVKYYIDTDSSELMKESNCAYLEDTSLLYIANIINKLADYEVPIYMDIQPKKDYNCKLNAGYGLNYIGLEKGIEHTYKKLLTYDSNFVLN